MFWREEALIIFVRNPLKGLVKTRLAEEVGLERALTIYQHLLEELVINTEGLNYRKMVFYDRFIDDRDLFDNLVYEKYLQSNGDLGHKMKKAMQEVLEDGMKKAVLIGSDTPDLNAVILTDAFRALDSNDLVIGPANDGGYYLIGSKKPYPGLFRKIDWGTERVLEQTLAQAARLNLTIHLLPRLIDIDTYEDLVNNGFEQKRADRTA